MRSGLPAAEASLTHFNQLDTGSSACLVVKACCTEPAQCAVCSQPGYRGITEQDTNLAYHTLYPFCCGLHVGLLPIISLSARKQ